MVADAYGYFLKGVERQLVPNMHEKDVYSLTSPVSRIFHWSFPLLEGRDEGATSKNVIPGSYCTIRV